MTALIVSTLLVAAGLPNVVLISADTLRADKLACYGYTRNTSPTLDQLAGQSLLFEDCVCPVPLTTPSFGALFSSRYPRLTGVTRNGLRMPEDVPLLTEVLQSAGYYTVCVQSNWPLKRHISGLHRGFDIYEDSFHKKRWGIMMPERNAEAVTDLALKFFHERNAEQPFFFWVHYSDPHAPYRFHKDFNPSGQTPTWLRHEERTRAKYDSEIAYMDFHIGRFLSAIPRDNTLIIFVADHGESLFEHGYLGHGRRIYQDNEHVPLMISGPGIKPGRTNIPASVMDIAPTLIAYLHLSGNPGMIGMNLLDGTIDNTRSRFIETYGGAVPRIPGATLFLAEHHAMRQGLIFQNWKFICGGRELELYDLKQDPAEINNRAAMEPGLADSCLDRIQAWTKKIPKKKASRAELSKDDIQAMESLGYLH